jgi:RNA polymerase sigma factor (sigma-70 family)
MTPPTPWIYSLSLRSSCFFGHLFSSSIIFLICLSQSPKPISKTKAHIAEDELVARLKSKDRSALEYLYDNYSGAIYGVIFRIVRKEEIAEEVLQDVFLKIWERFLSYDASKGRLFTWMVNVARNQAIDKTRSREIVKEQKTSGIENSVSKINNSGFVEQRIEDIGVKDILTNLPEEQRFVVEHLYLKGYTQSELAEEFNIPLGTVKTRLRLAMQQLRTSLRLS